MSSTNEEVRLDKWLWAARFYKTRSIARNMVDGGKVHYNGQRSKPSKIVELGAVITLRQGQEEKPLPLTGFRIKGAVHRKRKPSIQKRLRDRKRERQALARKLNAHNPSPDRRPDKKQRRDLLKNLNISK